MNAKTPFLEFRDVKKSYYGNPVLKGISFDVHAGEIHGLIGENGAGKSTLMNILFGMPVIHQTGGFDGEVLIHGRPNTIKSPFEAMAHGIGMVHQEFMLIPEMTIFENVKLNKEPTLRSPLNKVLPKKLERLDIHKMRKDTQAALKKVGLTIDELLPVAGLPIGHMQFIEIAREVDNQNLKLLVFDEPTAVLTEVEAQTLLKTMRHLAKDLNVALLFISHRLDEIKEICDRITVLKDGELVGNYPASEITIPQMAEQMVGRKLNLQIRDPNRKPKTGAEHEIILELKDFAVDMPGERVKGIHLKVRRGEILGLGGLAGQGKIGIANGISGLYPAQGQILKDGKPIAPNSPKTALENKIVFLSEDRRGTGLLLDDSIENNIVFPAMVVQRKFMLGGPFKPLQIRDGRAIRAHARKMIKDLDIRCTCPDQMVRRLSGGNQQKVCIARVITMHPDILMVSEPTRGVDVGAKKIILEKIYELNQMGMTIVFTSSELLELRSIADRIMIVADGKIVASLAPDAEDRYFGLAMSGDVKDLRAELGEQLMHI
jgi:simple sugar transport system ATP-binding protein